MHFYLAIAYPPPTTQSQAIKTNMENILDNFTIFRTNQFYFEDKYYLGKRVDYASTILSCLLESFYTHNILRNNGEYDIKYTVCTNSITPLDSFFKQFSQYGSFFNEVLHYENYFAKLDGFLQFFRFNRLYNNKIPTSGILSAAFAVALGYKEIYLAGIDLSTSSANYAFNAITPNLLTKPMSFDLQGDAIMHSPELDIETLYFLIKHYNVSIYSICPDSPINKYISIAKSTNTNYEINIESKAKGYVNDIAIPPKIVYDILASCGVDKVGETFYYDSPYNNNQNIAAYKQKLKNNIIFKILKDFIRLPSDIKYYLRAYIENRRK